MVEMCCLSLGRNPAEGQLERVDPVPQDQVLVMDSSRRAPCLDLLEAHAGGREFAIEGAGRQTDNDAGQVDHDAPERCEVGFEGVKSAIFVRGQATKIQRSVHNAHPLLNRGAAMDPTEACLKVKLPGRRARNGDIPLSGVERCAWVEPFRPHAGP
jgi:hypothetical protein